MTDYIGTERINGLVTLGQMDQIKQVGHFVLLSYWFNVDSRGCLC